MKNKKNVIKIAAIVGAALLLSVGAFFVYKKFGPKKEEEGATEDGNEGGTADADRSISSSNTSTSSSVNTSAAANAAVAAIMGGSSTPRTISTSTAPKVVSNYSKGQRVYARMDSGLYSTPALRSANITHQVKKDQPVGVFEKASVNGFAYLTVVLKDASGKYVPMIKYIPMGSIRPANISKGEKN